MPLTPNKPRLEDHSCSVSHKSYEDSLYQPHMSTILHWLGISQVKYPSCVKEKAKTVSAILASLSVGNILPDLSQTGSESLSKTHHLGRKLEQETHGLLTPALPLSDLPSQDGVM